jgi:hypothetical protein
MAIIDGQNLVWNDDDQVVVMLARTPLSVLSATYRGPSTVSERRVRRDDVPGSGVRLGDQGSPGQTGPQGSPGAEGRVGPARVGRSASQQGPRGLEGAQSPPGLPGPQGPAGLCI